MVRIILIGIFLVLFGCATHQNREEVREDTDRMASTARINTQLGMEYLRTNDVERARSKLLTAIRQAPQLPEVWYSMGYFMEQTQNTVEAKKYYLKAVRLAPHRGDVQNNYGTFLCRSGAYDESIRHFQLAVQDASYLTPADAMENAGYCALKIPDKIKAVHFFKRATQEDSQRKDSFLALSKIYQELGQLKEARLSHERYLALSALSGDSVNLPSKIHIE